MTKLTELTMTQALAGLTKKEFTAVELTQAHIDAVAATRKLNAFIVETPELAIAQAASSDARRAKGQVGLMEGMPIAMKDLFCTKGVQTTSSSNILKGFIPTYESTVSANLFNQGAVMLGKVAMDEFAMGSSTTTSAFGHVINPWRAANDTRPLIPGGSSGGSSTVVAARVAIAATGTDTGGSIRQPAGVTGLVGIKPTYGRCSRWGIVAYASSLDQAGPITRSVEDAAIMLRAMAGWDEKDSTSINVPVPDYTVGLRDGVKGLCVGIPKEYRIDGINAEVEKSWQQGIEWLREMGAEIIEISLPHTKYSLPAYYVISPAEASSNLARYDGMRFGQRVEGKDLTETYELSRSKGFGEEVTRRILTGTFVLSSGFYDAYYTRAQKVRALIARDFTQAFEKVDVILAPTAPGPAFPIGEKQDDPIKMYLEDVFTVPVNLAGLPGMSVPVALTASGLPLGLQIIGKAFDEATVLRAGYALEKAANFTAKPSLEWLGK
jgi:aspartyl-tRNA(Asn)/glutamyl-tRNA(Gln) amidotransferase subunit A